MTTEPPSLLTVKQAMQVLHLSRNTVYRLVQRRVLPSVRVGERKLCFKIEDLEAYIQQQRIGSVAEWIK